MIELLERLINTLNKVELTQWELLQKGAITPREYAKTIAESGDLKREYQDCLNHLKS